MTHRQEKIVGVLMEAASKFMLMESAGPALVTITNAVVSDDSAHATIFFTVLPEDKEPTVLEFAKRKRSEFKEFIKKETGLQRIPFIDFEIDYGEKNRQRIDVLSNQ